MSYKADLRLINASLDRLEPDRVKNKANGISQRAERNRRLRHTRALAVERQMRWRAKHRKKYNLIMRKLRRHKSKVARLQKRCIHQPFVINPLSTDFDAQKKIAA